LNKPEQFKGCLLGLAAGDALGTSLEFKPPGSFVPIQDMLGDGPFHLKAGEWTDDTSMALCLAESLIERQGFDPMDQMERYLRWYRQGHLSSNGRCFDIGNTVRQALESFERNREPYSGSSDPYSAGNGSLMRMAPVAMFYASKPELAIQRCADSSRTTHAAPTAVDGCRYFGALLVGALNGTSKEDLLGKNYVLIEGYWDSHPLAPEIKEIAESGFKNKRPPEIKGSGYVVRSLEAALWAFYHSKDFREGCLLAANLGDDADTTAAIYGQLAGAYYGVQNIPQSWRDKLSQHQLIEDYALSLLELSQH
jgi:ADP-ribosyl-[dinitrogen reductase] hydrolase